MNSTRFHNHSIMRPRIGIARISSTTNAIASRSHPTIDSIVTSTAFTTVVITSQTRQTAVVIQVHATQTICETQTHATQNHVTSLQPQEHGHQSQQSLSQSSQDEYP